jgi:hypothetical protein
MYYLAWNGYIVSGSFKDYGEAEEYKKTKINPDGTIPIRPDLKTDAIETKEGDLCLFISPQDIDVVVPRSAVG